MEGDCDGSCELAASEDELVLAVLLVLVGLSQGLYVRDGDDGDGGSP